MLNRQQDAYILRRIFQEVKTLPQVLSDLSVTHENDDTSLDDIYLTRFDRDETGQPLPVLKNPLKRSLNSYPVRLTGRYIIKEYLGKTYASRMNDMIPEEDVRAFLDRESFRRIFSKIGIDVSLYLMTEYFWFEICENDCFLQRMGVSLLNVPMSRRGLNPTEPSEFLTEELKQFFKELEDSVPMRKKKKMVAKGNNNSEQIMRRIMINSKSDLKKKFEWDLLQNNDANQLINKIFRFQNFRILAMNQHLIQILSHIKDRFEECHFKSLLDKYCYASIPKPFSMRIAVEKYTSHESVCQFIRSVLFFIFPKDLFGSTVNSRRVFWKNLNLLVTSGVNVKLYYKNFIRGIRTQDVPWLQGLNYRIQKDSFEDMIKWIVKFFLKLLKHYFYATQSNSGKSCLRFYRQHIWHQLNQHEIDNLSRIRPLNPEDIRDSHISGLRFLPKKDGLRMLNKSLKISQDDKTKSSQLLSVVRLLNNSDRRQALVKFADAVKYLKSEDKRYYFIRADISKCYPSILHSVLIKIIEKRFNEELGPGTIGVWTQKMTIFSISYNQLKSQEVQWILPPVTSTNDQKFLDLHLNHLSKKIIISGELCHLKDPMEEIKHYIQREVLKTGKKFFELIEGIRQGGKLSAELCTLYMEDFFWNEFSDGISAGDIILSEADDFVIITTSCVRGKMYLQKLMDGSPDYNLYINRKKLLTNIYDMSLPLSNISTEIAFFGYRYDMSETRKHEARRFSVDYTPYAGQDIQYSFNCNPFLSVSRMCSKLSRELIIRSFHPLT